MRTVVVGVIAMPLLVALGHSAAQEPLQTLELPSLQKSFPTDMATARGWKKPEQVRFEIDAAPSVQGEILRLGGWLLNDSAASQTVVIFPVGVFGLVLRPLSGVGVKAPGPPLPPPAPLPPMTLTLPPLSRVHLDTSFNLSTWIWDSSTPREIQWCYQFWNEPKPCGLIRLP